MATLSQPPPRVVAFDEALDDLPVFPLPNAVFFPGALLPLHIFEPRYRIMTRHCLATHRSMAVAMLVPGPLDENQNPPFSTLAGAGVIIEHEELADGRYNILLRGEARVELHELPFTPPYRRARAVPVPDLDEDLRADDLTALLSLATAFAAEVRAQNPAFDFHVPPSLPARQVLNLVASTLVADPAARQVLLEERSPRARLERAMTELGTQRARLVRRPQSGSGSLN